MADSAVHRAALGIDPMGAFHRLPLLGAKLQMVRDVDAAHDQHAVVFLNLTDRRGGQQIFTGRYLSRLQRAPEGAGQSAGRRGDEIVEGGGVRRVNVRIDAIVLGHLRVDAEEHRGFLNWEIRPAQWAFHPLDAHLGAIDHWIRHLLPSAGLDDRTLDPRMIGRVVT